MKGLIACVMLLATGWSVAAETPAVSLYDLEEHLVLQDGRSAMLDVHRGNKVLITMFYGGCQATCPMIIETLRSVESKLDATGRQQLRVLLISFDPEHDTPLALRDLAVARRIDTTRWTLASADSAAVRRIAAALEIQFRRLPEGQISHANVITVLGSGGEILARSTRLGSADDNLVQALRGR